MSSRHTHHSIRTLNLRIDFLIVLGASDVMHLSLQNPCNELFMYKVQSGMCSQSDMINTSLTTESA
jgi:hypothetical protein